jgi:hypothetical protein
MSMIAATAIDFIRQLYGIGREIKEPRPEQRRHLGTALPRHLARGVGRRPGVTNADHCQILRTMLDPFLKCGYLKDILKGPPSMPSRTLANQIAFRYRAVDSATGVTRETAKRLAEHLGVDETQAIHRALHELAVRMLPQYEADDGPLTTVQMRQTKKRVPQGGKRSVRSSLFDTETA